MKPISALIITITAVALLISDLTDVWRLIFAVSILVATSLVTATVRPIRRGIATSLLFLLPLFVIHGAINVSFEVSFHIFGVMPIRLKGVLYATKVASLIIVLFSAAISWLEVSRTDIASLFRTLRLPKFFLVTAFQAASLVSAIEHRSHSIVMAQKARGLTPASNVFSKVISLPSIIIPLTATLINESSIRAMTQDYTDCWRTIEIDDGEKVYSLRELGILLATATFILVVGQIPVSGIS